MFVLCPKYLSIDFKVSHITAYAALRPRDGLSHPPQEHMQDNNILSQ